jgi:MFS family permease
VPSDPAVEDVASLAAERIPVELRWLVLYGFLMGCGIGVVQAYLPLYAHERAGMTEATAGLVLSAVSVMAIPFGIGYARASGRFGSVATLLGGVAAAAIVPALALLAVSPERGWLVWAGAVGLGATAVAWNATGMLAIVSEVGSRLAGRMSGAVVVGFYAGFVAAPIAFGLAVDGTGSYAYGWSGMAVIYAAAALAAASAARSGRRRRAQVQA